MNLLRSEFPRWHFWRGVNGIWYASRMKTSPPVLRQAGDAAGLRDLLRRY